MILFGGQVAKKCWDIHELLSNVAIVTMLILGKLRNMDASSLLLDSSLSYGKTYFVSCRICHYGKEIKNLRLKPI